jgi:hypothetical protein
VRWEDAVAGFTEPPAADVVRPDPQRVKLYADLAAVHGACEAHALGRGPSPGPLIARFRERFGG